MFYEYVAILTLATNTRMETRAWGKESLATCVRWEEMFWRSTDWQGYGVSRCMTWREFRRIHPTMHLEGS